MSKDNAPVIVRKARLALGLTQEQFGQRFGVEPSTVSRWEHGKIHPSPDIWSQVSKIVYNTKIESFVRTSNLLKYIAPIGNLLMPILMSNGALEFYKRDYYQLAMQVYQDAQYPISGVKALELIGSNPEWTAGHVRHASAHCLSVGLNYTWVDVMVTALPSKQRALVEYAPSVRSDDTEFSVEITYLTDFLLKT